MTFFSEPLSQLFRNNTSQVARLVIYTADGEVYEDTYYNGEKILLQAAGSSVEYDRLRESRSTAKFDLLTTTREALSALNPVMRPEIEAHSGVIVDGEAHWAPLGRFTVVDWTVDDYGTRSKVSVSCVDRSNKIRESPWKQPFQTGGGTYRAAIEAILTDRGNPAEHTLWLHDYTAKNAPDLHYTETDDPWSAIYNLAVSSESEIYFAKNGFLVIQKVGSLALDGESYVLGSDEFLVEAGVRQLRSSVRDIYNGVIVRGEAPWLLFPISGEFWDEDPASPTWRYGPFDEKPLVIGSAIAVDDAHCDEIAESEFHKVAGVSEEVTFSSIKDPYLSVGAFIGVESPERTQVYTLDRLTFPMGSTSMRGVVRRKKF